MADKYEQLEKLGKLKEAGALTEEEFLKEKDKILGKKEISETQIINSIKQKIKDIIISENIDNLTNDIKQIEKDTKNHEIVINIIEELFPINENEQENYIEKCFSIFNLNYIELITSKHNKIYEYFIIKIKKLFETEKITNNLQNKLNTIKSKFNVVYFIKHEINDFNKFKKADKHNYNEILKKYNLLNITDVKIEELTEFKEFKQIFENKEKEIRENVNYVLNNYKESFKSQYPNAILKQILKKHIISIIIGNSFITGLIFMVIGILISKSNAIEIDIYSLLSIAIVVITTSIYFVTILFWKSELKTSNNSIISVKNELNNISIEEFINNSLSEITLNDEKFLQEKNIYSSKLKETENLKISLQNANQKSKFNPIILSLIIIELLVVCFFVVKTIIGPFSIEIKSNIENVKIFINGKDKGLLPYKNNSFSDTLNIKLTKEKYEDYEETISLDRDLIYNFKLNQNIFKVEINSNPEKVKLFINDEYKGETPYNTELKKGTYSLKLKKDTYEDVIQDLIIENDEINETITLNKNIFEIVITSNIKDSDVYIDDILKGKTPYTTKLNKGKHIIKLTKEGNEDKEKEFEINKDETITIELWEKGGKMVKIPGKKFKMDVTEITVEEFEKCVNAKGCSKDNFATNFNYGTSNKNHPINGVNWFGAEEFCKWAGKRLPTEDEWEYAAKGGDNFTYAGSNNVNEVAWYYDNSGSSTHKVATKKANGYGLYDMNGNVEEWTISWYNSLNQWRVLRGGGLGNTDINDIRVDYRGYSNPTDIYFNIGFRCVQSY